MSSRRRGPLLNVAVVTRPSSGLRTLLAEQRSNRGRKSRWSSSPTTSSCKRIAPLLAPATLVVVCCFAALSLLSSPERGGRRLLSRFPSGPVFVTATEQEHEAEAQLEQETGAAPPPAQQYLACDGQAINLGENVNFWRDYIGPVRQFQLDSGVALNESRQYNGFTQKILTTGNLPQVVDECLFGTLVLLLQSLSAEEYDRGTESARKVLQVAREVWEQIAEADGGSFFAKDLFGSGLNKGSETGAELTLAVGNREYWNVAALARSVRLFDRVLTPSAVGDYMRHSTNAESVVRVYVYDFAVEVGDDAVGAETAPAELLKQGRYLEAVGRGLVNCQFGMYGTEVAFHRYFQQLNSGGQHRNFVRVASPHEANLFFVPSYFKCVELLNWVDGFRAENDESELLLQQTVDFLHRFQHGRWWNRRKGADHVFLFSWGRHPCAIGERRGRWREVLGEDFAKNVIQLQVEDRCEDVNEGNGAAESTFAVHKDVIIPGYTDPWRSKELKKWNRGLSGRRYLAAFHGRSAANAESYGNVTIRGEIVRQWEELEDAELKGMVSIGGFVEDYHELLGTSFFCLAPRGITPWTIHLYIALLVGCVPVILSDHFRLPFSSFLDYSQFSIRWPERNFNLHELLRHLQQTVASGRVHSMKAAAEAHSCWFDYDLWDAVSCSPYAGVARELGLRAQALGNALAAEPAAPTALEQTSPTRYVYVGYMVSSPGFLREQEFSSPRLLLDFVRQRRDSLFPHNGDVDVAVVVDDYHVEELVHFAVQHEAELAVVVHRRFFPRGVAEGYAARLAELRTGAGGGGRKAPRIVRVVDAVSDVYM